MIGFFLKFSNKNTFFVQKQEIGLKGTAKGVDKSKPGTGAGVKPKSTAPGASA